jgi:hypothetical protein
MVHIMENALSDRVRCCRKLLRHLDAEEQSEWRIINLMLVQRGSEADGQSSAFRTLRAPIRYRGRYSLTADCRWMMLRM